MMPRQFGPDQAQAVAAGQADELALPDAGPPRPVSAKPEEITTRPCTPFAAQSSTTSCTASAGTATIATSTVSGMSPTVAYAGSPATDWAAGFTTYTRPW